MLSLSFCMCVSRIDTQHELMYVCKQLCLSLLFNHNAQQRMEQKNRIEGKNSSLNDSRLERLQRIGFRWAKRKGQASWDEKFVSSFSLDMQKRA